MSATLRGFFDSSVGAKVIVAVTGLALVGFLIAHVSGNLLVFAGPQAMYDYAEGLRKFPAVLWALRLGLLAAAIAHIYFTIKLNIANKKARPVAYAKKQAIRSTFASRYMVLTGAMLFFFLLFHLAHFTFRVTSTEISTLGPYDVHQMLIMEFQNPIMSILYIVAVSLLGFHLSHGVSSLFQTLGLRSGQYAPLIEKVGPLFGLLLAAAYISIPVAIWFGFITS